jgi:hypothetical protein
VRPGGRPAAAPAKADSLAAPLPPARVEPPQPARDSVAAEPPAASSADTRGAVVTDEAASRPEAGEAVEGEAEPAGAAASTSGKGKSRAEGRGRPRGKSTPKTTAPAAPSVVERAGAWDPDSAELPGTPAGPR